MLERRLVARGEYEPLAAPLRFSLASVRHDNASRDGNSARHLRSLHSDGTFAAAGLRLVAPCHCSHCVHYCAPNDELFISVGSLRFSPVQREEISFVRADLVSRHPFKHLANFFWSETINNFEPAAWMTDIRL